MLSLIIAACSNLLNCELSVQQRRAMILSYMQMLMGHPNMTYTYHLLLCYPECCGVIMHIICCYVIRVRLIGSVPGAHIGPNMTKWGHLKLKKVI